MIRRFSIFITILLLAGSASADHFAGMFPPWLTLEEPGPIPLGPFFEDGTQKEFGEMVTAFQWNYSNHGPERFNVNFPREQLIFAPLHDNGRTTDQFNFDTIVACSFETSIACSDKFWTTLGFGTLSTTIESGFHAGTRERGLEVEFNHYIAASDEVQAQGQLVFSVNEDTTYTLTVLYKILGDGIRKATLNLFFYEAVRVEQTDPDNKWSIWEWQRLVSVQQFVGGGGNSDVVLSAPNAIDCRGCPSAWEGATSTGHDFEGTLKANAPYRLMWSVSSTRDEGAVGDVFPEGKIALVVPEPSINLMGFAGILGLIVMGRRRHLKAKVS